MTRTENSNIGASLAVTKPTADGAMLGMDDDISNLLTTIARVAVTPNRTAAADRWLDRKVKGVSDPQVKELVNAIISNDPSNDVAQSYRTWARKIRDSSNGSKEKRQKNLMALPSTSRVSSRKSRQKALSARVNRKKRSKKLVSAR
jgi:hypothetical protein